MRCHEEVPEVVLQYALNSKLSTMKSYGNEKRYVHVNDVHVFFFTTVCRTHFAIYRKIYVHDFLIHQIQKQCLVCVKIT